MANFVLQATDEALEYFGERRRFLAWETIGYNK